MVLSVRIMNCCALDLHPKDMAGIVNSLKLQHVDMDKRFLCSPQTPNFECPQMFSPTYCGGISNYGLDQWRTGKGNTFTNTELILSTTAGTPGSLVTLEQACPMTDNLGNRPTSTKPEEEEYAILHAIEQKCTQPYSLA